MILIRFSSEDRTQRLTTKETTKLNFPRRKRGWLTINGGRSFQRRTTLIKQPFDQLNLIGGSCRNLAALVSSGSRFVRYVIEHLRIARLFQLAQWSSWRSRKLFPGNWKRYKYRYKSWNRETICKGNVKAASFSRSSGFMHRHVENWRILRFYLVLGYRVHQSCVKFDVGKWAILIFC